MIVERADVLGYCMGVRKAVDAVWNASDGKNSVFTFGPLIHNPEALALLIKKGIRSIDPEQFSDKENYSGAKIVIRAHGISPLEKDKIKKTGAEIIDATCPRVLLSQKRAKKYAKESLVILAGDKNHGELIGIAGYVLSEKDSQCIIVQNAQEAEHILLPAFAEKSGRAVLIAQTTIKKSEYDIIAKALQKRLPNLIVLNTICPATSERQEALKKLANKTEAILVIGGKNSANTKRLLQTALDLKKPAWLIENAGEIPNEIYTYHSVGLTAGASTPDFVIDEVEKTLLKKNEYCLSR